jgi:AcrR family transcriptional regulator
MDLAALPARDRILATAHDLFYRDGIRATGIDRIIAQAGVAKLTFYRHFAAKDDLVAAFLEHRHGRWMAWFVDALGRHGARPAGGLGPLAPVLAEWFGEPQFRGCAFINAVAELGDSHSGAVAIARRHKQEMVAVIGELVAAGKGREVRAEAAALAVDGAIVRAQVAGPGAALEGLRVLLAALG